jgi:hypothetical protein
MKLTRGLIVLTGLLFFGTTVASAQAPRSTGEPKAAGEAKAMSEMNRHTMDGEVTKVDAKKGWIDVKTSEGSMKLHFPPEALADVKKGDSVSVELGLKDNGPSASASERTKKR